MIYRIFMETGLPRGSRARLLKNQMIKLDFPKVIVILAFENFTWLGVSPE